MKRLALLFGALTLAGCDLNLSDLGYCEYSRDFSDEISASGLSSLLADVQAGDLRIEGHSGSNHVRVHARACARSRRTSEDIDFALQRDGGAATVTSHVPSYDDARLDLVREVPAGFDIDVYDGSGDIDVRNVYSVWIDDGSGDIYVEDLDGDFVVYRDGSGRIDYRNVRGLVQLP